MRILNVYPQKNHQIARFVNMLCHEMPTPVEMMMTDDASDIKKIFEEKHPDIVHVHGAVKWNITNDFRIVASPHGESLTHDAYVVIARSEMERRKLSNSFDRLEVVRNPFLTKTTTNEICCRQTMDIYNKVLDSDVLPLMDTDTEFMIHALLKAGITGDHRWVEQECRTIDWHKLHIYAHYQGITNIIKTGASILGIEEPADETFHSYLPSHYHIPSPLERHDAASIISKITDGDVSLLRFVELDMAFRSGSIDEEGLLRDLKEQNLDIYLPSILQILKEVTWLDEGFMPCLPKENRYTNKLRTLMTDYLRI